MSQTKRFLSLDFLKALGIIYIVVLHEMMWLFIHDDIGQVLFPEADALIMNFAAYSGLHVFGFILPLLAGTTFYLSFKAKGLSWLDLLKRVGFLIAIGFGMNYLSWGIGDAFDWDVLQFIALAMLCTYPIIKYLSGRMAMGLVFCIGVLSLIFSNSYPDFPGKDSYLYIVIFGDGIGEHFWPLCPWLSIFCAGILLGEALLANKQKILKFLPLLGIALMGGALCSGHFFPGSNTELVWGPKLFKTSFFFQVGIIGFACLMIPLVEFALMKFTSFREKLKNSFLIDFGRGILWIYIFSTVIGYNGTTFLVDRTNLSYQISLILLPIIIILNLFVSLMLVRYLVKLKSVNYE